MSYCNQSYLQACKKYGVIIKNERVDANGIHRYMPNVIPVFSLCYAMSTRKIAVQYKYKTSKNVYQNEMFQP